MALIYERNAMYDEDGRCTDCDGKYRHFAPCAEYMGEPVLTLEQRVELYRGL